MKFKDACLSLFDQLPWSYLDEVQGRLPLLQGLIIPLQVNVFGHNGFQVFKFCCHVNTSPPPPSSSTLLCPICVSTFLAVQHVNHLVQEPPQKVNFLAVHRCRALKYESSLCKIDRGLATVKCNLDVLQILHVVGQDVRQGNLPILGEILDWFEQFCKPGISHLLLAGLRGHV